MRLSKKKIESKIKKRLKCITPIQVFIILVVIAGTVFIIKSFGKKSEWKLIKMQVIGQDWSRSYVEHEGYRPPYWLAESINEGDVELGVDGSKHAEVIKVERYKRVGSEYDTYLTLNVKGVLNTRTKKYVYKGRAIEVGAPISLNLNKALVIGQVIDDQVPKEGYQTKKVIVTGRIRNTEPWIISNLNIGDKMTSDNQGGVVAEVLTKNTEPAQSQILFSDSKKIGVRSSTGSLIVERNPRLRDLVLTVELTIEKHGNEWYFGGHQNIKVGNNIWLYFPQVDLKFVEIESIRDVNLNENR